MSRRTVSLAASRDGSVSTASTTASTSASVPVSREQRKSGNRLMVVCAERQYHRAIRQPGGETRSYGGWRGGTQPPPPGGGDRPPQSGGAPPRGACRFPVG